MFNIVERYIQKMTKEDVNSFALSKNITLSEDELNFTYEFIKKNYQTMLKNPQLFDINRYRSNFSEENFHKVNRVFQEYFQKYARYL